MNRLQLTPRFGRPDGHELDGRWPKPPNPYRKLGEPRRAAAQVTGVQPEDEPDRDALASLLGRSHAFLTELERWHLYPYHPI